MLHLLLLLLLLAHHRCLGSLLRANIAQALQLLVMALRQGAHIEGRESTQNARVDSLQRSMRFSDFPKMAGTAHAPEAAGMASAHQHERSKMPGQGYLPSTHRLMLLITLGQIKHMWQAPYLLNADAILRQIAAHLQHIRAGWQCSC